MVYERLLQPLLFRLDAESAHERALAMLKVINAAPGGAAMLRWVVGRPPATLPSRVFGMDFPNPLGLAAGFDKDAQLTHVLSALGFGFLEVGSVTLKPQPGNPKPRLFRLPEHRALINRMGFNSRGAQAAAKSLSKAPRSVPIGVNLGLNKDCPQDQAPEQYAATLRMLRSHGDYFVVNVSSPNTTGLRNLQERLRLTAILEALRAENAERKPILVKISPDMTDAQLDEVLDVTTRLGDGIVAINTTISRPGLPADLPERQGGLSGSPLRALSTGLIRKVRSRAGRRLAIIGGGGIFSGAEALDAILAGASLVQLYTSLIYRGPSAAVSILRELDAALGARGFASVAQAIGQEGAA